MSSSEKRGPASTEHVPERHLVRVRVNTRVCEPLFRFVIALQVSRQFDLGSSHRRYFFPVAHQLHLREFGFVPRVEWVEYPTVRFVSVLSAALPVGAVSGNAAMSTAGARSPAYSLQTRRSVNMSLADSSPSTCCAFTDLHRFDAVLFDHVELVHRRHVTDLVVYVRDIRFRRELR